ncbi:DUF624 domain-containing protein [Deinococcus sp. QL22]|uniref:DUF624 domain-containing protein n=1 Tax=Deinococcus sp. QL22 TaxID=2939437 RepID=UPI0020171CE5|nr:DUF624 domain-containing protein [Deinococcus sp. QL22]UQN08930.1 DUF624 domain-containing protein [Deinococcus sp. QL22]
MSLLPRAYREGGLLTWRYLLPLVWLNLIWLALSWTLVLAGPATLASYALIATTMREDREPDLRLFPSLLRHNLLPGLLWCLTVAVFAFLMYSNLVFWRRLLGNFGDALVSLLALYLSWLFVALQPYLLEALSVQRLSYRRAWQAALLGLVRTPVSAHLYVLIPLLVVLLAFFFRTFGLVILVSIALTFAAVQVRPITEQPEPAEPEPAELAESESSDSAGQLPRP